ALSLNDNGTALSGSIAYASDLFDRITVERMMDHWTTLLTAMVADDSASVARLPLLTPPQRAQVLQGFHAQAHGDTPRQFERGVIHHGFEAQVALTPDAPAVSYEQQTLSYAELDRRANQVAHRLIALGVKPDDRVAICVERSLDMVVGLLGILKAGGGYVPLDPAYPADRLAYMLEDSAPVALLSQSALRASLPQAECPVLELDDAAVWAQARTDTPVVSNLHPHHLAYVIYTSGSTGQPKGVMVEHGQVSRLFASTDHWFGFNETDVWTLFHSFAFDFSVWELWGALLYGGRVVVVPSLCARSPSEFYDLLVREGV
ncbi:AMP-binding protein, partial [Lysobacter sp. TAB13]|uniref:AMP-binding protein n=1 Tax=Lysobacter sp. TAB13 TaxID=3233065 RepID=UPI003F9C6847